ncbi:MAG: tetratricopeptide repeat protein [Candidatus Cloacimonadota bacterium]|nr:MAG: tetratricopeptide repeat protein [Candidatus Cloacimonadota bacterium]
MKCLKCGKDNPGGSKFCNQCGILLPVSSVKADHLRFARVHIPQKLRKKMTTLRADSERKNVTILFADISGFTALSEKLDPEEVTELINNCFEALINVIYKYEGTIDKFIGDCIMVLFGAPITHEDDPERAVHTALEIMGALDRFNEEGGTKLSIHIGINAGVVIAGGVGSDLRMDYTVMGDTVNLAERLMGLAKDEIFVSESVYKKTNYLFEMNGLAPVKVKGKTKKIKPYRVIGVKEKPKRKRRISELYSPLVGRNEELNTISAIMNKRLKENAAVLALIGEAGLGKSRLIEEMRKETGKKWLWLNGRSYSYGSTTPFWVVLEQVRNYLGIGEFVPELDAIKKLKRKTKELFGVNANEYLPYLSLFLSIKVPEHLEKKVKYLDYESLRLQEFVSVKAFFRMIAQNKPLILYFEDIQWLDPESLELIGFLLEGLKDTQVLFLFEARPEKETGLNKIKPFIQKIYKKRYTEIRLKPLNSYAASELLSNLLSISDFPENLSSLILEKSECNPFYIEEIIHSLIDSNILVFSSGIWTLSAEPYTLSTIEVPETVEAVIRARIDKLPLVTKDIIGNASVIGRNFHYQILSHITDIEKLDDEIKILEGGEFILNKISQFPIDLEYQFKHTLIRDVAYNGLLKKKRRRIHRKIAEYMEDIFREKIKDYFETLAHHYYYAGLLEKSYEYYRKAGDDAKKLYLNNASIEYYVKAIEIHKKIFPDKRENLAELFEKKGDVHIIKAEYDVAFQDYKNASNNYKDIEKKADIKRKIGELFFNKADYNTAISLYGETIDILRNIPSSPVLSKTLLDYAWLLSVRKSEHLRAEKMTELALAKIDKKKESRIYAQGLNTLGGIFYNRGNYNKALKYYQKTLTISKALNDKKGIGTASNNIGLVYHNKGELDTTLKYYKRYLAISEEIGDKKGIGIASNNIGGVYHNKGELSISLDYYKKYLAISEEIGYKRGTAIASGNIGIIYRNKGNLDTALRYYKKYLSLSKEIGFKHGICLASCYIGVVHLYKGELDTSLKYYKKYHSIAKEIDYKKGIGDACLNIGKVCREMRRFDNAKEYLEKAEEILLRIGDRINLSEVYANLSELNTEKENFKDALKIAEKALSITKETGAKEQEILALRAIGKALFNVNMQIAEKLKVKSKKLKVKSRKAISYLKQSISLAKGQKRELELAKSLYELSKILNCTGKKKEAEKYKKEAKSIFEKAGAKNWLYKIKDMKNKG